MLRSMLRISGGETLWTCPCLVLLQRCRVRCAPGEHSQVVSFRGGQLLPQLCTDIRVETQVESTANTCHSRSLHAAFLRFFFFLFFCLFFFLAWVAVSLGVFLPR